MRIYVWNVLVKIQGSDWFCIVYLWKMSRVTGHGGVVLLYPSTGADAFCFLTHSSHILTRVMAWEEPGHCSVLARKDSQQPWHRNEHLGVCLSFEGAQGPLSRDGTRGAHTPPRDCPTSASLPYLIAWPEELPSTVCNPWRIPGQLTLGKGRMSDTLFVFLLSPIPKLAIKSLLLSAINWIRFSDSQMFCLGQACCWSTTLLFHTFSPVLVCSSSLRHTFIWKVP